MILLAKLEMKVLILLRRNNYPNQILTIISTIKMEELSKRLFIKLESLAMEIGIVFLINLDSPTINLNSKKMSIIFKNKSIRGWQIFEGFYLL